MSRWLRYRARIAGFDPRGLARVEQYLRPGSQSRAERGAPPLQRPANYFPGLAARPWHDPADLDWTHRLEAASVTMRDELSHIMSRGFLKPQSEGKADSGEWTVYRLYSLGTRIEVQCRLCPETVRAVESLPALSHTGLVYFSVLAPGTHIIPHCGPTNTRLRCHLGLVVPDGCRIRVGDEVRGWEEGRCIVFDDSFEHEVWNDGLESRVVLILDVWHPDLTPVEVWALEQIIRSSASARRYNRSIRKPVSG